MGPSETTRTDPDTSSPRPWVEIVSTPSGSISVRTVRAPVMSTTDAAAIGLPSVSWGRVAKFFNLPVRFSPPIRHWGLREVEGFLKLTL